MELFEMDCAMLAINDESIPPERKTPTEHLTAFVNSRPQQV